MTGLFKNSFIGVLLGGLLVVACKESPFGGSPPSRNIASVQKGNLAQRVTIAGTIVPKRRTVILPPYHGYVKRMYVKIGDKVRKGAPIVSVVQSLTASRDEIYPIRAPFPGTVVQVLNAEGEYVREGDPKKFLVRIDDLSKLYIESKVPEIDIAKLRLNQPAIIKVNAILGRPYMGVIREISLAAEEKENFGNRSQSEFLVKIEITNPDDKIKPGMSSLIDVIAAEKKDVLTLRHEYIQKEGNQYFVILENGKRKDIEVGLKNEEKFEIAKGLNQGERVRQTDFLRLHQKKP